jgi:type IV pilus assembly protein PilB
MAEQTQSQSQSPGAMPDLDELKGRRLGRILIKMGRATRDQVEEALNLQKDRRAPIGQLLIELGYIAQSDLNIALAAQAGMETVDLDDIDIEQEVIHLIPSEMAQVYNVVPLFYDKESNELTVALKSPENFGALDDLRLLMGFNVKAMVAPEEQIDKRIAAYYQDQESLSDLVAELSEKSNLENLGTDQSIDLDALVEATEDSKVKRLLNLVLLQSIKDHASDLHLEPFEHEFKMRYRVDGTLYELIPPPRSLALPIVSRIKVMASLDIAERRVPQDGRIELMVNNQPVDLRVSILPTMFGESAVLRVLDRANVSLDLGQVGMRKDDLDNFRQLIHKPNGIVIVTGPTGSGKTTTLYSALAELNQPDTKLLTVEDPVEYDIDGLIQVQINNNVGLTFARALRSFLRQDPDVILVGETRDLETAKIAVEAALTGHLVFTTLHTNDAPSTVARLLDLGLEAYLVNATVEGVLAQRLVRRICQRCKSPYDPTEQELMELSLEPEDLEGRQLYRGRGCEFCNGTGYKGRMGLFEMMVLDDEMRELVSQNASTGVLREEARKRGMRTLREAGLMALYEGWTTIEEVVQETLIED